MIYISKIIYRIKQIINRASQKTDWHNLRSLDPVSKVFGGDRGTPIDRIYIEHFLNNNKHHVKGIVCEIGENVYSKKFNSNVEKFEILHFNNDNPNATIIGDLCDIKTLPADKIDCFILTQTLNFIYDINSAIKGIYHMLKKDGVALITVSGISQISRYDMDRWGDYWRFTDLSLKKAFEEVFGSNNVIIEKFGNVLTATSFLQGIAAEELSKDEIFYNDDDYQLTLVLKATKRS